LAAESWSRKVRVRENEINERLLPNLTAGDLKDLGVSIVGHRRTLLDAIAALRVDANVPAPTTFTPFYEKLKNKQDWVVHTLPCTHIVQIDMPNELSDLLLRAVV